MDVSVIIVNYNTSKLLLNCLDSIKNVTTGIEYEVIVVDNDSKDGSQMMVKKQFPWVKLIESKTNLGFGKANNLGSQIAVGKYLFYLNSDTVVLNNALKIFFDFAETYGGAIGALGCVLSTTQGETCHSYGQLITMTTELRSSLARYLRFLKYPWMIHPPVITAPLKVGYITGADLFVPKKVYNSIGGFDEEYFMYCEEVDWQKRMDNIGLPRIVIPGPEIIHLEGGSDGNDNNKGWSNNRIKNIQKSRQIYYKKHFNKFVLPFFILTNWILQLPWRLTGKLIR